MMEMGLGVRRLVVGVGWSGQYQWDSPLDVLLLSVFKNVGFNWGETVNPPQHREKQPDSQLSPLKIGFLSP